MRAELEQVAQIEQYLMGNLTKDEALQFEDELARNKSLAKKVQAQDAVMAAIKQIGLRASAQSAYVLWRRRKMIRIVLIALLLVFGAVISFQLSGNDKEDVSFDKKSTEVIITPKNEEQNDVKVVEEKLVDSIQKGGAETLLPENNLGFQIVVNNGINSNHSETDSSETSVISEEKSDNENLLLNNVEDVELDSFNDTVSTNQTKNTNTFNPENEALKIWRLKDKKHNGEIDVNPSFPEGEEALRNYLEDNLNYPEEAIERGVEGTVFVSFVITRSGRIKEVKVVKSLDEALDAEAIKIVKNMPKWNPAKRQDRPVSTRYTIPVEFTITNEIETL